MTNFQKQQLKETLGTIFAALTRIIKVVIHVVYQFLKTLKVLWLRIIRPLSEWIIRSLMYGKNRGSAVFLIITFVGVTYAIAMNTDIDPSRLPAEYNAGGEQHPTVYKAENIDDWVKKHCTKDTYDIVDKVKWYAEYQGVRPEVVFAISWADSNCGKRLKSKNNFGNVGNNDRGDTVAYKNAFSGWKALVDALNNDNMRGLQKIGHLSGGGRKQIPTIHTCDNAPAPHKCYATTIYANHINNMVRALKGMNIKADANYPIRI